MRLRPGLFFTIFGLAVVFGYGFQEPRQLSNNQSNGEMKKATDRNTESMPSPDLDQRSNLKAREQEMQKYPDIELASISKQRLKEMRETLASSEFRIAKFYVGKGNPDAATSRLKTIINKYADFSRIDEVKKMYETLTSSKQPFNLPQEETE